MTPKRPVSQSRRACLATWALLAFAAWPSLTSAQDCNSLYAARLAENAGVPDCQTVLVGVPRCAAGQTADQCADTTFVAPPLPSGGTGAFKAKWVEGPLPARCVDGTRPIIWVDKAVDVMGNDLYTNDWLFFTPGEGGPCTGSESRIGCYEKYASPLAERETANGLSSMHPDAGLPKRYARFGGILSPKPAPTSRFNPFMSFNRVHLERCTSGVGQGTEIVDLEYVDPVMGITGSPLTATTALVYHDGDLLWEQIFAMLGTVAGRDLGGGFDDYVTGPDLPPIAMATTVLFAGASDTGKWLIHSADRLEARIEALNPMIDVNAGVALDGHSLPSLQHEMVRQDPANNANMFVAAHANNGMVVFTLPSDNNPASSDDFGNDIWQPVPPGNGMYRLLSGMGALLDASCEAAHGAYSEYCLDEMHVVFHHLTTPVFHRQDQRDNVFVGAPAQFSVESAPPYAFPALDHRDRVFDQFLDYVNNSALAHEPSAAPKGILSTDIGRSRSHVVFTDNRRSLRDRMLICSGTTLVNSWNIAGAIHDWLTNGTELTLIERATQVQLPGQLGPGETLVRARICP